MKLDAESLTCDGGSSGQRYLRKPDGSGRSENESTAQGQWLRAVDDAAAHWFDVSTRGQPTDWQVHVASQTGASGGWRNLLAPTRTTLSQQTPRAESAHSGNRPGSAVSSSQVVGMLYGRSGVTELSTEIIAPQIARDNEPAPTAASVGIRWHGRVPTGLDTTLQLIRGVADKVEAMAIEARPIASPAPFASVDLARAARDTTAGNSADEPSETGGGDALAWFHGLGNGNQSAPAREPLRIHVEWDNGGARVWIGVDHSAFADTSALMELATTLERILRRGGAHLTQLVCNGQILSPTREDIHSDRASTATDVVRAISRYNNEDQA